MTEKLTDVQIKEILTNINVLLSQLSVAGDDVFRLADCRRALTQVINQSETEEKKRRQTTKSN